MSHGTAQRGMEMGFAFDLSDTQAQAKFCYTKGH